MLTVLVGCSSPSVPQPKPAPAPPPEPIITNSYDFAASLGLEADYLKELHFDASAKEFIGYLGSLSVQMRGIAEDSGLIEKLITDKQITGDEEGYFKRVVGSYQNEIETMQPFLKQISEKEATDALALNLSNFLKVNKNEMFYNLDSDKLPLLLPQALFVADGVIRKYASEIVFGDNWGRAVFPYASTMVDNINNFWDIHARALDIANDPDYMAGGHSIEDLLAPGYFKSEAVGSTDNGINAAEDINLLLQNGSDQVKAVLRLYARNLTREGRQGIAEQVRVELTGIDSWSIGIYSYEVVIAGHDVPAIQITEDDIALLKSRSPDPLLILDLGNNHYLPLQWTRTSILKSTVDVISVHFGTSGAHIPISDLKLE